MVPAIFKDQTLQDLFDRQGFVVVPFLDAEEVALLDRKFDELHPDISGHEGFTSGSYSNDMEYKQKASDFISSVYQKHFDRLFADYQGFGAAYLYKMPSDKSALGVHQDWTIVDEDQYVAINCWVPLTDIDQTNGALHVLPGSHYTRYKTLRAPTVPFFFTGSEVEVIAQTIPMYVPAGHAVILNQSLIHYSPPNRSQKIRKAITAGVKSKKAPMLFHYKTQEGKIERYLMPENFLISFENFATSIFQRPASGQLISTADADDRVLDRETLLPLLDRLQKDAGYKKSTLLSWIPSFFHKLIKS